MMSNDMIEKIQALKKQRDAVILAHNYVDGTIQEIADFIGDSLELSIRAKEAQAKTIVFCGVRFMAETAKLLSPDSVVLLPRSDAGCPMADMATAEEVRKMRKAHPNAVFVAYVNSTAEVKAEVDICCTSANAGKIVESIPKGREVVFLPERNLGGNISQSLQREFCLWNGCCPIHDRVTPEMIQDARKKYPGAEILVHPECRPEVIAEVDQALSTGGMIRYIAASDKKEFVVGTESGIFHRLLLANPDKKLYKLEPELICADMKKITLTDVLHALETGTEEILLDAELAKRAVKPIEAMLQVK